MVIIPLVLLAAERLNPRNAPSADGLDRAEDLQITKGVPAGREPMHGAGPSPEPLTTSASRKRA